MLRRKKPDAGESAPDPTGLRRYVFGDCPLDEWPPDGDAATDEPWRSFDKARSAFRQGDDAEARRLWLAIADSADESRNVLQAWHFLCSAGVAPPDATAKHVLGVVVEVAVPEGHDLLAAYEDGSARYLNYSGAAVVVDARVPAVDAPARELLAIGQALVEAIGPWEGPLPDLPRGHSRLTMLTPLGPHFGQGPDAALRQDKAAGALLDAATRTLLAVVELSGHAE